MNSKDQAVVILGLLIILLVAGGVFWAHPRDFKLAERVAGVQTTSSFTTRLGLTIQTEVNQLVDTTQAVAEQNIESGQALLEKVEAIKTEAKENKK
jgi:hypothetical protein